jgi:formamidopyrimidine-DNA glycosylase
MPELPEVQTTVNGINATAKGRKIIDVWTSYNSVYHLNKDNIKDPKFFKTFKKIIVGEKILRAERMAKNILIHLSGGHTMLIHMKMTGHVMYGKYEFNKKLNTWKPASDGPLADPFNAFIRFVLVLDNGKHLVLSDMRRFAKVTIFETSKLKETLHLSNIGPEPLEDSFTFKVFKERLMKKPRGKVKQVLMDPSVIAGIGNIYSDEILWRANVHPASIVSAIPEKSLKLMFNATKSTLNKGIDFGGDSMSDYRNIHGERGKFQDHHQAYRRTGKICSKKGCSGIIQRMVIGTRSAHFCPIHQELYK